VLVAIWDYVLLLEVTQRFLEIDKVYYQRNHELFGAYVNLQELYQEGPYTEADFSERLSACCRRWPRK
jgi:hypothetical protein